MGGRDRTENGADLEKVQTGAFVRCLFHAEHTSETGHRAGDPPTHTHTSVLLAVCSSSWAVSDKKGKVRVRAGKPEH